MVKKDTGVILKWGMTRYPNARYRTWFLRSLNAELKPCAASYDKRLILDQERMMCERYPGKMNHERRAGRFAGGLSSFVLDLDPTPIGMGRFGAHVLINDVDPMVKKAQNSRQKSLEWWLSTGMPDDQP